MISNYTSSNKNFESGYPHSNALKPHKAAIIHQNVTSLMTGKFFPTVYRRIYCCKFLTLSNQTSCYKIKCIRIENERICMIISLYWPAQINLVSVFTALSTYTHSDKQEPLLLAYIKYRCRWRLIPKFWWICQAISTKILTQMGLDTR